MLWRPAVVVLAVALSIPAGGLAVDTESFDEVIDDIGRTMLARFPEEATDLGLSAELGLDDTGLDDLSPAYLAGTVELAQDGLDRLARVDVAALSPDERITHAVVRWYLEDLVTMAGYAGHEYPLNFITGPHVNLPEFMADVHPLDDIADAEAYVARLEAASTQLGQVGEALVRAEAAGILPTRRGLDIARWQIGQAATPAERNTLVTDLATRLAQLDLAPAEQDRLVAAATDAVSSELLPAYEALGALAERAASRPDTRPGVLHLPDGDDYYAAVLRHHTGTSLTPQAIHAIGLAQVERLRGELIAALGVAGFDVEELGFGGAVEAAGRAVPAVPLRSEADRATLLAETEVFVAGTATAFGDMFTTTPSAALEVRRPRPGREGAGAYYRPPSIDGERPGIYYLGLSGNAFPMDTYATTNYHEAVPGHHFQIALQREADELPLLQRATTFTGYAEGWALYAERLAQEAGRYADDPLGDIGRLRMELLRAARVVADTGIHALGWSREQAIDYLMEQGLPEGWAASEVDRYIVWPGQAPAYMLGLLEILRLRDHAQTALGEDFDLAAFHDAILRHGSVPLEILPLAVDAYIESASA